MSLTSIFISKFKQAIKSSTYLAIGCNVVHLVISDLYSGTWVPVYSLIVLIIACGALVYKWQYQRRYIMKMTLEPGWKTIRYSAYNFLGPTPEKILPITKITRATQVEDEQSLYFNMGNTKMILDKNNGTIFDKQKLWRICEQQSLIKESPILERPKWL